VVREHCEHLRAEHDAWYFIFFSSAVHIGLIALVFHFGTCGHKTPDRYNLTRTLRLGVIKPADHLPDKLPAVVRPPSPATAHNRENTKNASDKTRAREKQVDYAKEMKEAISSLMQEGGRTNTDEKPDGFPEGSRVGDATVRLAGDEYITGIEKAIQANYSVPDLIPVRERLFLQAVAVIRINSDGSLINVEFQTRSGNQLFDDAVEATIRRSAPFPPPPAEKADSYSESGIPLVFDAKSRR
jgi:TonB family protein